VTPHRPPTPQELRIAQILRDAKPPERPDIEALSSPPRKRSAPRAPFAAVGDSKESPPSQTGGSPSNEKTRPAGEAGRGEASPSSSTLTNQRLAFLPLTDLGNAERFVERNRGKFIACSAIGWLRWDNRRWCKDGVDERVRIAAHETVRAIQDEADAIADTDLDTKVGKKGPAKDKQAVMLSDKLRAWGRRSEANSALNQLADQAQAYLSVLPHQLDADGYAINVRNGTLRVKRDASSDEPAITFTPHDPADFITKLCPVDYDQDATCPRYDEFLSEVQPTVEMRRFLHQWMGLSLTGETGEARMAIFWGVGRNGKSVFMETAAHIAGDYSTTVPVETFVSDSRGRNAGQATPDLAKLPGVRLLRASEAERGGSLQETLIKSVTGGDQITARNLNRPYFDFYPQFKLTITGNQRPNIKGTDEGIWSRVTLVPWTVVIAQEKRDPQLLSKLKAEASGILNRYLDGLRDWLDHGLKLPDEVKEATAEYRRDHDALGRFLEEATRRKEGSRVGVTEALNVFNGWAIANGINEWKGKGFSNAMTERGYRKIKSDVMQFLDIELIKSRLDYVDYENKPIRQHQMGMSYEEASS
jgi:putative DNA primase/helicase